MVSLLLSANEETEEAAIPYIFYLGVGSIMNTEGLTSESCIGFHYASATLYPYLRISLIECNGTNF